jgi:hypothetical protein
VEFFEKFYVDREEEIMKNASGFKSFGLIHIFLEILKVQSKLNQ